MTSSATAKASITIRATRTLSLSFILNPLRLWAHRWVPDEPKLYVRQHDRGHILRDHGPSNQEEKTASRGKPHDKFLELDV